MNKLRHNLLVIASAITFAVLFTAACGDQQPDELSLTDPLPTIGLALRASPQAPATSLTVTAEPLPDTPTMELTATTDQPDAATPTLVLIRQSTPTPETTETPTPEADAPSTPQPQTTITPNQQPSPLPTGETRHVFPTPNLPTGIGAPPLPPTFSAPQVIRSTATPVPTAPIFIDLEEDDPINSVPWYQDGLSPIELEAIDLIRYIADSRNITVATWLDMPAFNSSIEPSDINALKSLTQMQQHHRIAYWYTMLHSTVKDGIRDDWTHVVATLPGAVTQGGENTPQPRVINQILNPKAVSMQLDTLTLQSGITVQVAIIRTTAGDATSIERLKQAIQLAEQSQATPFPQRHVALLFAQWPTESNIGGQFHHSSITMSHRFDVGYGNPDARNAEQLMQLLVTRYYMPPTPEPQPNQP